MPLLDYIVVGVWHICIGFDHILFLVALLLPSVWQVQRRPGEPAHYAPYGHMKSALREVLSVITCFTISHSLTLWLVVSETVEMPSRWVETAIAGSIVVTAILNLYPKLGQNGRWITLVFWVGSWLGVWRRTNRLGPTHVDVGDRTAGFQPRRRTWANHHGRNLISDFVSISQNRFLSQICFPLCLLRDRSDGSVMDD